MALISPSKTIKEIEKEITLEGLRAALVLLLNSFLKSFNVTNGMNTTQVAECVDLLIMEFPHYRLEDFKVCFMYSKTSRYGKVYNRIDSSVVFDMFREYDKERKDILANDQVKKHGEIKMLDKAQERVGWDKKKLSDLMEMARGIAENDKPKKLAKPITPNEIQKRDNEFLRRFDKLCGKFQVKEYLGKPISGTFIQRYGAIMGPTEYLKHKVKQLQIVTTYLANKTINHG